LKKPVLTSTDVPARTGSRYPSPHNVVCENRTKYILGDNFDLTQFGVNLAVIEPGAWSSQRHWHEKEDEFIYMLEGELVLADDSGDHVLTPGMCAGFKANNGNGHCLKNLTDKRAVYLEVGSRMDNEKVVYSDIDMKGESVGNRYVFTHKNGTAF
jgi:uncharacterized cupin superfamily protein